MITAYLQGGLGNQMFQIAAAYNLSLELNVDCAFDFNLCYTPAQGKKSNTYKETIFKNVKNKNLDFNKFNVFRQPRFAYDDIPKLDNQLLLGDFQSEKYFIKNLDRVKSLFNIDKERLKHMKDYIHDEICEECKLTTVHVRRGDYLTKPNFHPTCTIKYYKEAMLLLNDVTNNFLFISDDINWCRENFVGENIFYSPFTNELDDLYLLMVSDNNIIANSSFSWWGAYLNENNNKVVSPSIWFGPQGPQDTDDIYLENWIKICS